MKTPVLYVVATPLGNLDDISPRAAEIFRTSHFIIAEDTRKARVLLEKCRIPKKNIISFFEGNEREKTDYVIRRIKEDGDAAL
ncbi:MAG: 16S rRNA (cytidine(1402)-2'-O)-methyltransferase, partial [bacterium]|nr:16S rRNA (cytidine(1402)-2'-O)-methyltransferase [bacterium]